MRLAAGALAVVAAVAAAAPALVEGAPGQEPVTRDCGASVYGDLGSDWMPASVVAGPLAFVRARFYASSQSSFLGEGGRYRPSKLLVVVRTGWVARVVVPAAQRGRVALRYEPATFNDAVAPSLGAHDVTFTACPPGRPFLGPTTARRTQFNGAVTVAGRRCVTLFVYAAKQGHPLPERARATRLSFGAGVCR